MNEIYTYLWLGFGALFIIIEGAALMNKKPGGTLSEHVWHWVGTRERTAGWKARRGALAIFLIALAVHLLDIL